jgi:RNA-directed DNA polymerase
MKSWSARALAVRRVTQDNQGKKTAGVDGIKAVGPMARRLFVERLRHHASIKPHPVRRVLIPKPGRPDECRPLGMPVLLDRAHQALAKLALDPHWERRFEGDSYGFRPGRSPHDALAAVFLAIRMQAKYVLEAAIRGAFDNIAQRVLLAKLDTFPALSRTIKGWLRAGVMHEGGSAPPTAASPKGAPSPRC